MQLCEYRNKPQHTCIMVRFCTLTVFFGSFCILGFVLVSCLHCIVRFWSWFFTRSCAYVGLSNSAGSLWGFEVFLSFLSFNSQRADRRRHIQRANQEKWIIEKHENHACWQRESPHKNQRRTRWTLLNHHVKSSHNPAEASQQFFSPSGKKLFISNFGSHRGTASVFACHVTSLPRYIWGTFNDLICNKTTDYRTHYILFCWKSGQWLFLFKYRIVQKSHFFPFCSENGKSVQ